MNKQELLQKYLNNECSTEELLLLYNYLQKDDVEEYQEVLCKIWQELELHADQSLDETVSERVYDKIRSKINGDSEN